MWKELKAFLIGVTTAHRPYRTNWDSFDELSAYDLGRAGTLRLIWRFL